MDLSPARPRANAEALVGEAEGRVAAVPALGLAGRERRRVGDPDPPVHAAAEVTGCSGLAVEVHSELGEEWVVLERVAAAAAVVDEADDEGEESGPPEKGPSIRRIAVLPVTFRQLTGPDTGSSGWMTTPKEPLSSRVLPGRAAERVDPDVEEGEVVGHEMVPADGGSVELRRLGRLCRGRCGRGGQHAESAASASMAAPRGRALPLRPDPGDLTTIVS